MKKIGPSKIPRKILANADDIDLPPDIEISLIFSVANLYPYREPEAEDDNAQEEVQWMKQLPTTKQLQIEKIIDQRIVKKTIMERSSNRRCNLDDC
jgi:hypothetical protein